MMGCGKSTIGRQIAERLFWRFVDLDEAIEDHTGKRIAHIFEDEGEQAFRELEREQLQLTAADDRPAIIATGGGTPVFSDNMDWINAHGLSIYLRTPPAVLAERLFTERYQRPLLARINSPEELVERLDKLIFRRRRFYEQAQVIYEQRTGTEPVAEEIAAYVLRITGTG